MAGTAREAGGRLRRRPTLRPAAPPSLLRAVVPFAVAGLIALAVLAVAGTVVLQRIGESEALRQAVETTQREALAMEPDLTDELVAGDQAALAHFDQDARRHVLGDRVLGLKIWAPDGRIVYADNEALIGRRFELGEDQRATLATGSPLSNITDLTAPENLLDRSSDASLLEVYQLVHTPSGQPLLFEAYLRHDSVTARGHELWTAFAPALLIALLALELLQLPLAWRLTRRLQQGQRERDELHRRAVEASSTERRRIAADLHDGVVQTFTGVSYWLAAVRDDVAACCPTEVSRSVEVAADSTRRGIQELRTLVVDIYPPSLRAAGLSAALADLLAPLPGRGLRFSLQLPDSTPELPEPVEELLYRGAQEAVRNVLAHAHAQRVDIVVSAGRGAVVLEVHDDGRGCLDPEVQTAFDGRPRLGLSLLSEAAAGLGGRLDVASVAHCGTTLRLEIPVP